MNTDEPGWVEGMRKSICEQDYDEEIEKVPVSIFAVPKVLIATNPECYIPQQVALGPIHHWRPEVFEMQRYKLAAARRTQKCMNVSFYRMVEIMKENDEARIRACYHKFLDMSGDALVWMMAVDIAFLLEFLQVYSRKEEGRVLKRATSHMSHLVDVTGKKLSHMAILRDLVMVENQIPLFLIKRMLDHQGNEAENRSAGETLKKMLMGLYRELSPLHDHHEVADVDIIEECDHILDFMYHITVPNNKEHNTEEAIEVDDITQVVGDDIDIDHHHQEEPVADEPSDLRRFVNYIWNVLVKSKAGLLKIFKLVLFGKFVKLTVKFPWAIISSVPILKDFKEPIENIFQQLRGERGVKTAEDSSEKAPLIEEITIPSVVEMAKAGILVSPVKGGISRLSFDNKTSTLYLPVVELDVNTEVYLRNLVAYEACVAAGPLVIARYTELMNGIIDTKEDARFLRERGIVLNHLKSDQAVADLWNEMSKSVKLTKVPDMDKVIEDVNKRYARTWRVKSAMFMRKYVFASWKILTMLATLFMLLMTFVDSFCSVYDCRQATARKHLLAPSN